MKNILNDFSDLLNFIYFKHYVIRSTKTAECFEVAKFIGGTNIECLETMSMAAMKNIPKISMKNVERNTISLIKHLKNTNVEVYVGDHDEVVDTAATFRHELAHFLFIGHPIYLYKWSKTEPNAQKDNKNWNF